MKKKTIKTKNVKAKKSINYEPAIVTFIDILGFRSLLDTRSAEEILGYLKRLKQFAKPSDHEGLEDEVAAGIVNRAYAEAVSDAIVRVRPYDRELRDGALFWELLDLLFIQLEMIGVGILIRAGVTTGDIHVGEEGDPIFGPALRNAYDIESKKAIYPRIAIDSAVIRQHQNDPRLRSDDNTLEYETRMLKRLLKPAGNNLYFIDYLSSAHENLDEGMYPEFLRRHAELVRAGLSGAKTREVRNKYLWLKKYHNAHVKEEAKAILKSKKNVVAFFEEYGVDPKSFFKKLFVT